MRVTELSLAQAAVVTIDANLTQLGRLSRELATGSLVADPSQDPAAAALLLQDQEQIALDQQGEQTAELMSPRLDQEVQMLRSASQFLTQARTIMVQAQNGTLTASDRTALASQLQGILDSVVGLANRRTVDRPLFSGTSSLDPFVESGTQVTYVGDQGTTVLTLSPGTQIVVHEPGTAIFLARTDTATGTPQGSGSLGLSGIFSVNGTAVAVTGTDTLAGIAAKINAAGAGAAATITGGTTLQIASLSTSPLALADTSGTVLQSLGILTAGGAIRSETLPDNAFDALAGAIDDLQSGNLADLSNRLAEIDRAQTTIGSAQSYLGSQQAIAQNTQATLQQEDGALQAAATKIGGADLAQVSVQYQATLTAYQAALAAAAQAMKIGAVSIQG